MVTATSSTSSVTTTFQPNPKIPIPPAIDEIVFSRMPSAVPDSSILIPTNQLTIRKQPQLPITAKTESPDEFFAHYGIDQMPENPFTEADLEHIYTMIQSYTLSLSFCFDSLFIQEFAALLSELKELEIYLKPGLYTQIKKAWLVFVMAFHAIIRSDMNEQSLSRIGNLIREFLLSIENGFNNRMEEVTFKKSPKINERLKKNHETLVVPHLEKWKFTLQLFTKFFSHKQATKLLFEIFPSECLGASEILKFSKHQKRILDQLQKYIQLAYECTLLPDSETFPEIDSAIKDLAFMIQKKKELNLQKLHTAAIHIFFSTEKILLERTENPVSLSKLLIYNQWTRDFFSTLEQTICPISDPSFLQIRSYEKRVILHILELYEETYKQEFHPSFKENSCPFFLGIIYTNFIIKTKKAINDSKTIEKISEHIKYKIFSHLVIEENLRALQSLLKSATDEAIKDLHIQIKIQPNSFSNLPLLEMTASLARSLIILHDLDVLFEGRSPRNCLFPDEYIDLIGLGKEEEVEESNSSSEEEPEELYPNSEELIAKVSGLYRNNFKDREFGKKAPDREFGKKAPQNFCSEQATIAQRQGASENENCEAKPTQTKTDSSSYFGIRASHLEQKNSPPMASRSLPSSSLTKATPKKETTFNEQEEIIAEVKRMRQARKRTLKRLLKRFGCVNEGGANHDKETEAGITVTVVKRHGKFGRGLLHAMGNQMEEHLERKEAPKETPPSVERKNKSRRRKK